MAESSWPYTSQATTDIEYSYLMRELGQGVTRSNGDNTLKGSGTGSAMVSYVEAGRAIVRGYMYNNTAQVTLAHDAADANPRIDTVVIKLDVAAVTPSLRAILVVLKGTAAASPVPPTLTQSDTGIYHFPLFDVNIAAGSLNVPNSAIVDRRVWRGTLIQEWTTALRPSSPTRSQMGYNTTLGYFERWNGTAWVGLDSVSVGGRRLYDGTGDPAGGLGSDNDVYFKTLS